MECSVCGSSLNDVAFIGRMCIDCYSESIGNPGSPMGNLARKAVEGARRAAEARRQRKGRGQGGSEDG